MGQLIDFVAEETDYPLLETCPIVRISSVPELRSEFTKASAYSWDPLAAYLTTSGEILINNEIDIASLFGRSVLLHEIVHAAQFSSGDISPESCTGLLESEAYRVQASYLEKHDLAKEASNFLWMSLMLNSACTQYDYYK